MIWLKSFLFGILAVIIGSFLSLLILFMELARKTHSNPVAVGVGALALRDPAVIVFLLLLFTAGFAISFYRLK